MINVMFLRFRMQEEDVFQHTNVKCHLCTLLPTPTIVEHAHTHPITLLNVLMPRY